MELKTNYQYTYFIHPFVIKEAKYQKYILKMLKDIKCNLKIFQKEKDLRMYKFFLPKTREFLFSSFAFGNNKLKQLEELPLETRAAILSKYPCTIFEYNIEKDIQGKMGEKSGIFFDIQKVEVICFNSGICFVVIKTNVEDYTDFSNILNFNYKFRDINREYTNLDGYDNIKIQTDSFSNMETFQEFIHGITGSIVETSKLNIDTERFFTYSYACIDQEFWNNETSFDNVKTNFAKYANVLSADDSRNIDIDKLDVFSKWKYAKIGLTKLGMMMFSSSADINNYTIMPDEYENQYFYTYLINLYKKIYLKKISIEFNGPTKVRKARKKFVEFTKEMWIQEISDDEIGTLLNHRIQNTFELENLYGEVKVKFDALYKEFNIEKDRKITFAIGFVLIASLIFNVLNFIVLSR